MLRRTLIARLRRHTRIARALTGRAPVSPRAASGQTWARFEPARLPDALPPDTFLAPGAPLDAPLDWRFEPPAFAAPSRVFAPDAAPTQPPQPARESFGERSQRPATPMPPVQPAAPAATDRTPAAWAQRLQSRQSATPEAPAPAAAPPAAPVRSAAEQVTDAARVWFAQRTGTQMPPASEAAPPTPAPVASPETPPAAPAPPAPVRSATQQVTDAARAWFAQRTGGQTAPESEAAPVETWPAISSEMAPAAPQKTPASSTPIEMRTARPPRGWTPPQAAPASSSSTAQDAAAPPQSPAPPESPAPEAPPAPPESPAPEAPPAPPETAGQSASALMPPAAEPTAPVGDAPPIAERVAPQELPPATPPLPLAEAPAASQELPARAPQSPVSPLNPAAVAPPAPLDAARAWVTRQQRVAQGLPAEDIPPETPVAPLEQPASAPEPPVSPAAAPSAPVAPSPLEAARAWVIRQQRVAQGLPAEDIPPEPAAAPLERPASAPEPLVSPAAAPSAPVAPSPLDAARAWVTRQQRVAQGLPAEDVAPEPPIAPLERPASAPEPALTVDTPPAAEAQAAATLGGVATAPLSLEAAPPSFDRSPEAWLRRVQGDQSAEPAPPVAPPSDAATALIDPEVSAEPPAPSPRAAPRSTDEAPAVTADDEAFDRSPWAWMERLRAQARRETEAEAPPAQPPLLAESVAAAAPPPVTPPEMSAPIAPPVATPRAVRFVPPLSVAAQLSDTSQRFLEAVTGVDPATVRAFRGPAAERATTAFRADALTIGEDVALAAGQGDETPEGLGLLAHELTHVAREREPGALPPIMQPREQTPGVRPAAPGADEEALARAVETQTIQAARARFVPPVSPPVARAATMTPPPIAAPAAAPTRRVVPPAISAFAEPAIAPPAPAMPEGEDSDRWGGLPAPWEPLPSWLATPHPPAGAPIPPTTLAPAPPVFAAPPGYSAAPAVRAAETGRDVGAPDQSAEPEAQEEAAPAPDLDALARQVYAVLKRRLATERRRGW